MALMAVDSVTWAWSCPMPAWGRSAAAIDMCPVNWASSPAWMGGVVGHLAEADPGVEHGWPDRRVGVAGVGASTMRRSRPVTDMSYGARTS